MKAPLLPTDETISILVDSQTTELVPAEVYGPLAINRTPHGGYYAAVHVKSGYAIVFVQTIEEARLFVWRALASRRVDWSVSATTITLNVNIVRTLVDKWLKTLNISRVY